MSPRTGANRRLFYVILVSVLVTVVIILAFNRHGLLALADLKAEVDSISLSIESLTVEIDSLESEIRKLSSDSLYLERMVREILGWGRSGEYIIRFPRPSSSADTL